MARFPQIPIRDIPNKQPIEHLVEQILAAKRDNAEADVTAEEKEIDRLVYEIYGLTADEIDVVQEVSKGVDAASVVEMD